MTLREHAIPPIGSDDVLIRVAYSGICGSELSGYLGTNSLRTPPLVFGHELAGHIEAIADAAAKAFGLTVGVPVTVNPLVTCGDCAFCLCGRQQLCARRQLLGAHRPGSNAEFVVAPARSVVALPAGLELRDAAMAEPAACAVHAVELSGARPAMSALVVGAGPIGLFIAQVLREFGLQQIFVAERNPDRLARAVEWGFVGLDARDLVVAAREATAALGVDMAFDAVGSEATRKACLGSVASGGQVMAVGLHSDMTSLPLNTLVRSEVSIRGVFAYPVATFRTALRWLAEHRIGLRDGVVVAPLSEGDSWYQRLIDGDAAAKVLLDPRIPSSITA
jgi:2-desacetyl-2-hydroxyethyl bacteriochlorophyllide A dehydrogenase